MAGISSKALNNSPNSKYKFNGGNELQSGEFSDGAGLELYDAQFRLYDAQIGRFNRVDPLSEFFDDLSPYNFAFNNPVLFNDPFGLSPELNGQCAITGYVHRPDGSIYFDPNVNSQDDLDPSSGLTYLGERLKLTDNNGNTKWWDENGQSTTTDPGWENLQGISITGNRKRPRNTNYYLDFISGHYNGIRDNLELGAIGLGTIKKSTWNKGLYEFNKSYKYYNDVGLLKPGKTSSKIVNGIKGAGKIARRLGPVGNLMAAGNIVFEVSTDLWDAHTVIEGTLVTGAAVVVAVATAPVATAVAVGVLTYGALDYFFDIGGKVDATVGRKGSLWRKDD